MMPKDMQPLFNQCDYDSSMLDDLIASDHEPDANELDDQRINTLEFTSTEGFTSLDLRKLGSEEFSVILAALMARMNWNVIQINDSEIAALTPSSGLCSVLACEINSATCDIRFTLSQAPASEFRK